MLLSLSPATLSTVNKAHAQTRILSNDPLGVFQGTGSAAVYYPGTGGIDSTSFASSSYYSLPGQNTTYTYTVSKIPSGNFSVRIPLGQTVLNITTPTSTTLSPGDYTGFYRAHNIPLSLFNGRYILQATSNSSANAGIRTRQFSILIAQTCCDTLITTITIIAVVAVAAIGLALFYLRRKRRTKAFSKQPPTSSSIRRNKGEAPKKSR